jgi:hypothetical protein
MELDYVVQRFERLLRDFGLEKNYCIVYDLGEKHFGMTRDELTALSKDAVLLMNLSGTPEPSSPLHRMSKKAYFDLDPAFTQMWALGENDLDLERYHYFFTVGQNVGRDGFTIPANGVPWQATVPPVVLDEWPARIDDRYEPLTTVADWWGSQTAYFEDKEYGGKRSEFLRFLDLPERSNGQKFELALCMGQRDFDDIAALTRSGWELADPYRFAGDPHSYRQYIQHSRGEYSVAKSGYVTSKSGWISDRTVCYLATGKPALVQSTGFESSIPTGNGLLTFEDLDGAIGGVQEINRNYQRHCNAARQLAEERFNSDIVLRSILSRVGL